MFITNKYCTHCEYELIVNDDGTTKDENRCMKNPFGCITKVLLNKPADQQKLEFEHIKFLDCCKINQSI